MKSVIYTALCVFLNICHGETLSLLPTRLNTAALLHARSPSLSLSLVQVLVMARDSSINKQTAAHNNSLIHTHTQTVCGCRIALIGDNECVILCRQTGNGLNGY